MYVGKGKSGVKKAWCSYVRAGVLYGTTWISIILGEITALK